MSTAVKNRNYIALGMAEIFISDSASHIGVTDPNLSASDYFSAVGDVSFSISKEKLIEYSYFNETEVLQDIFTKKVDFKIMISFLEIYNKTLSYALGGDGGSTELGTVLFSKPQDLRVELVFTYPNRTNFLKFIMPRMSVLSNLDGNFLETDAIKLPLELVAKRADNISGGGAWSSYPYGRQIFI